MLPFLNLLLILTTFTTLVNTYYMNDAAEKNIMSHGKKNSVTEGHCGCMVGPPGAPGIPGVPGYHGIRGDNGMKGEKGYKGEAGQSGMHGKDGKSGAIGPVGTRGRRGEKGDPGLPGVPGSIGIRGGKGYDGIPGAKGNKGEPCPAPRKIAFSVASSKKRGPVSEDSAIMFENIFVNIGNGFHKTTSHFISNVNGIYSFTAHILGEHNYNVFAWIMLNDTHKAPIHADSRSGYGMGSQTIILNLRNGDYVWVQLSKGSVVVNDYTTFSGQLLFEDDLTADDEISNHIETNNYDYWRLRR